MWTGLVTRGGRRVLTRGGQHGGLRSRKEVGAAGKEVGAKGRRCCGGMWTGDERWAQSRVLTRGVVGTVERKRGGRQRPSSTADGNGGWASTSGASDVARRTAAGCCLRASGHYCRRCRTVGDQVPLLSFDMTMAAGIDSRHDGLEGVRKQKAKIKIKRKRWHSLSPLFQMMTRAILCERSSSE